MSDVDIPVLPEGTRLIHIGPHKTGTTSLQGALWTARNAMRDQGVLHAGRARNPANAVRAVTGQASPFSETEPPPISEWERLANELRTADEPRVVVSSEFFAWAKPADIARIVDDVGLDRVHVVVTLRPLAKVLPSMWQQNVQAGHVYTLDEWLERILNREANATKGFWQLHHHDRLIARWAAVVGIDRMTAIVVDDRDHGFLHGTFERLLGLRAGTLSVVDEYTNRSLTMPEVEAVRAFNVAYKAESLPRALNARMMRFGAAHTMKRRQPRAGEPRVELPAWAADRVAAIATEVVAGIAATGVRTIGDPGLLTGVPALRGAAPERVDSIPPDIAASMAMGVLHASGRVADRVAGRGRFAMPEPGELARLPLRALVPYLGIRLGRLVAHRASLARQRLLGRRSVAPRVPAGTKGYPEGPDA